MSEPQKKGTPILMKFFGDAFAAYLNMIKVNLAIHQYREALAPSGESDNELLQAAIQAIGNAKPTVQNSLMTTKRILELPDLPKQLVDDIDLYKQWCEISLQDLDLCDSTIRNLIMSKGDYLTILKNALDPYREQLGIDEEYEYPDDYEAHVEEERPAPVEEEDAPVEESYDAPLDDDVEADVNDVNGYAHYEEAPVSPSVDANAIIEELELRHKAEIAAMKEEMERLQRNLYELSEELRYNAVSGSEPVQIPVQMVGGIYDYPEDEVHDDATLEFPMDVQDDILVDEVIPEGGVVADDDIPEEEEPMPVAVEQPARPTLMRISPVQPAASRIRPARPAPAPVVSSPVEEPAPAVVEDPEPIIEEPAPVVEEVAPVIAEEPPCEAPAEHSDNGYEGLFGYDQYDSVDEDAVKPLSEDPDRFQEIGAKASEVIAAARKKVGRTAAKSPRSSPKSKSGAAKKPSKPAPKRTVKKKAAPKATTTNVEETDSETPSHVAQEDE